MLTDALNVMRTIPGAYSDEEATALWRLVKELPPHGNVVEVGCQFGRSTSILAQAVKEGGQKMTVVDNWTGDRDGRVKKEFWENMQRIGLNEAFLFIQEESIIAASCFPSETIDLLHLDSDHQYAHSVRELEAWIPKMRRGGVMAFHDYANPSFEDGIRLAVDESNLIKLSEHNTLGLFEVPEK